LSELTTKKIAEAAGVSQKTVSRVLNDEKYVSKETKEKVLRVVKELGFEPNFFARGLRTKESKTVGLVLGDIENPFYSSLSKGIIGYCEDKGYNTIVCTTRYAEDVGDKYIKMLRARGVDGLLLSTIPISNNFLNNKLKIPYVLISYQGLSKKFNIVTSDDYLGGVLAIEYLLKLGHRRFHFLKVADVSSAGERLKAFKDTLNKYNISFDANDISKNLYDEAGSYNEVKKILKSKIDFTAIIAANDFIAMGAMNAILEKNLNIPNDISLIGYDDINISKMLKVSLTTIRQPIVEMGRIAAKRLLELINNPDKNKNPKQTIIKPELIIRESCKKI
jgi:LacI family transcriptional regulator